MANKIFYSSIAGFIFGILLRSFLFFDIYFVLFLALLSLVFIFFFKFISFQKWGIVFFIFTFCVSLGVARFHFAELKADKSQEFLASSVGQKVEEVGVIVDDPTETDRSVRFAVELNENKNVQVLVSTDLGEDYKYGDEVEISGKLEKPENFATDTGKEFDYVNYLRKDEVYYLVNFAKVRVVGEGRGNPLKSFLFSLKNKFLSRIGYAVRPPESTLLGGLILGEKSAFSAEQKEAFVRTGTIHIVALSGYNITVVSEWFMDIFKFLPRNLGLGMGMLAILLFVIMTGGQSTALRAGVMALIALVARATGRTYDVARALILTLVLMIALNPFVLVFDISFQLSFIATIAVIFFTPKIERYFLWVTKSFGLREIFAVTSAAYIFVLPFILYKMGNFSLLALPANILVLPFVPWTMGLGFITGILGLIYAPLALPTGFVSYYLLHYELWVVNILSSLPFASYAIPNFPLSLTIVIYAYFAWYLFGPSIKSFFELAE